MDVEYSSSGDRVKDDGAEDDVLCNDGGIVERGVSEDYFRDGVWECEVEDALFKRSHGGRGDSGTMSK